jgi:hypothetical protein
MLFAGKRYIYRFIQHLLLSFVFITADTLNANAQTVKVNSAANNIKLNPFLRSAFKVVANTNPLLSIHLRPTKSELMYWPNYPLTATQIEARNKQWERRNSQTFGEQVASDIAKEIIKNQINAILYGRKNAPAVVPRF